MSLKQSPRLGNKYTELYSLILSQMSIYIPRIMPRLGSSGDEQNILYHEGAPWRRQGLSLALEAQRQHRGGSEELQGAVGRAKVSGKVFQNKCAWTDSWKMGRCLTRGIQHLSHGKGTKPWNTAIWPPQISLPVLQIQDGWYGDVTAHVVSMLHALVI